LKNKPNRGRAKVIRLLTEYLSRNKAINKDVANQSYREASRIKSVLLKTNITSLTDQELKMLNDIFGTVYSGPDKTIRKLTKYLKHHAVADKSTKVKNAGKLLKKINTNIVPVTNALDKVAQRFDEVDLQHKIFNEIQISELINDQLTPN
jgi:hypothetical protein